MIVSLPHVSSKPKVFRVFVSEAWNFEWALAGRPSSPLEKRCGLVAELCCKQNPLAATSSILAAAALMGINLSLFSKVEFRPK